MLTCFLIARSYELGAWLEIALMIDGGGIRRSALESAVIVSWGELTSS